jgi:hypothetical protein
MGIYNKKTGTVKLLPTTGILQIKPHVMGDEEPIIARPKLSNTEGEILFQCC